MSSKPPKRQIPESRSIPTNELEGSLEGITKRLTTLITAYGKDALIDISAVPEPYTCDSYEVEIVLHSHRAETDVEYAKRLKRSAQGKVSAAKAAKTKARNTEIAERREYARLKEKFGGKKP